LVHHRSETRVYMDVSTGTSPQEAEAVADEQWAELRARLRSFIAGRVRDEPAIHEDLVQDALVRLHRGLPRLRRRERLDAFAYQVTRNVIADHYRRGRREDPVEPASLEDRAPPMVEEEDDSGAEREQLARCLRPLVDRLEDDYRDALLLTDLGDLSQAEAARRLGLSAPGMRSRVQRGRARLHEELGKCCRVELDAASQIDRVERVGPCACSG
jgi:RNA polymerase sigma-70 factor, ECF subfamily